MIEVIEFAFIKFNGLNATEHLVDFINTTDITHTKKEVAIKQLIIFKLL